jgi:hypothetical protein
LTQADVFADRPHHFRTPLVAIGMHSL